VVERNVVLRCDRGIAFGNPSGSSNFSEGMLHVYDSICRNNFVSLSPDAGIELAWVDGIKLYHNTVWREDLAGRGIRCIEKLRNVDIANNLIRGALTLTGEEKSRSNIVGRMDNWFMDPPTGDLRIVGLASDAIDRGIALRAVDDDIDAIERDSRPDIGADEFGR
jgi:hypothetical protein